MTVEVLPITEADVATVADFLRAHHNPKVPWERACGPVLWDIDAPNLGFMLCDGQRVVGTLLALYSERVISGRVERFCNLGSWCVLPDYRSRSMFLLRAMLAQEGYNFTVLSPDQAPQEILKWQKFRYLDTSAALLPNLPWPTLHVRTRISEQPEIIDRTLNGPVQNLYRDHAQTLAARHLVVTRGNDACYVMYRICRYRGLPVFALLLYVSDSDLFRRSARAVGRHLLLRHGLIATVAETRIAGCIVRPSFKLINWPKMYRSASLRPEQVDDLYSELACVPW